MQFYSFGFGGTTETGDVELLGGKGAGLVWLANEGVPVPPGFVIPTTVWAEYDKDPKATMAAIATELPAYMAQLEKHFGYRPLVSVRSGARVSCPGMMDTILNVGLDGTNLPGWIEVLGPKCFGDSFLRLVQMYGSVVDGLRKDALGPTLKDALDGYQMKTGHEFPKAEAQLLGAIEAVFKSWDNDRAVYYRKQQGYNRAWGTAVTVQSMVFGNLNEQSGTGVLFTRNVSTGANVVTGEFLANAQGEDIVAGIRTPLPLGGMQVWNQGIHASLVDLVKKLEAIRKDALDIEFTVQDDKLYILQVRTAKRTPLAAVKIATDLAKEGVIDVKMAVSRVSARMLDQAQEITIDPAFTTPPDYTGIGASNGIASGKPVFSKEDAINCTEPCILVTHETTPEDIAGIDAAVGVVTMVGGYTSHAAVVTRPMNKPCVVGVGQSVDVFKHVAILGIDGTTGHVWTEPVPTVGGTVNGTIHDFQMLVCEALGVVPVIFGRPVHAMAEAVLYLGDTILDTDAAADVVFDTLGVVNTLYLDLLPGTETEQGFYNIIAGHDPVKALLDRLKSMGKLKAQAKLLDRLVLVTSKSDKLPFKRVAFGGDLQALILATESVLVDSVNMADPAVQKVVAWKAAEGVAMVSLGKFVVGAKSMVSPAQALQAMSGEGV